MKRHRARLRSLITGPVAVVGMMAFASPWAHGQQAPAPPSNLTARDKPWDTGEAVILDWDPSPDDPGLVDSYVIYRSMSSRESADVDHDARIKAIKNATEAASRALFGPDWAQKLPDLSDEDRDRLRVARQQAEDQASAAASEAVPGAGRTRFKLVESVPAGQRRYTMTELEPNEPYSFKVEAMSADQGRSAPAITGEAVAPTAQIFDGSRLFLAIITAIFCSAVVYWIYHARKGRPIKVRKIAGLEAVDEAVGRATEMGRSCLYVPGIQDINEIQTIASMTILARVARTAAQYDAKVEVPTSRSLVMTTARETVQAAFLAAGRPDAYNKDLIYYVTDEQFGYVAYLSGMMVREKPAACFYMGAFFAESLILAETGNSIGAIQVAGTAMPAQLPFFVAACDYTLIGEEFFAASAYLSGSAEELGSLKGQDVGKVVVAVLLLIGVIMATLASIVGTETAMGTSLMHAVSFLRNTVLT